MESLKSRYYPQLVQAWLCDRVPLMPPPMTFVAPHVGECSRGADGTYAGRRSPSEPTPAPTTGSHAFRGSLDPRPP